MAVKISDTVTLVRVNDGEPGHVGRSLLSETKEYYLSTTSKEPAGGSWSETKPEYVDGRSYFTRFKQVWDVTDGTKETLYTPPVLDMASTMDASNALTAKAVADNAKELADNANKSADGKNSIFYQSDPPTGGTYKTNDLWFDTDDSNTMYYWNGSAWTKEQFGVNAIADLAITNAKIANGTIQNAKIANLDAGKITTGYLSADRIAANSINGNKIVSRTVTGDRIAAGTITANEINVKNLFAQDITATGSINGATLRSSNENNLLLTEVKGGRIVEDSFVKYSDGDGLGYGNTFLFNEASFYEGGINVEASVYSYTPGTTKLDNTTDFRNAVYDTSKNPGAKIINGSNLYIMNTAELYNQSGFYMRGMTSLTTEVNGINNVVNLIYYDWTLASDKKTYDGVISIGGSDSEVDYSYAVSRVSIVPPLQVSNGVINTLEVKADDVQIHSRSTKQQKRLIGFGVGSGGDNRGIYDFQTTGSDGKTYGTADWLIYWNANNEGNVNTKLHVHQYDVLNTGISTLNIRKKSGVAVMSFNFTVCKDFKKLTLPTGWKPLHMMWMTGLLVGSNNNTAYYPAAFRINGDGSIGGIYQYENINGWKPISLSSTSDHLVGTVAYLVDE